MREDQLQGSPQEVRPPQGPPEPLGGRVGIVVIGRNEGRRLERCLDSVLRTGLPAVYVDSGSTDGSPDLARSKSVPTEVLSPDRPYTAARARNAGRELLRRILPQAAYVQFVDGDCELDEGWVGRAAAFLDEHEDYAAVAGLLHERDPRASVYNRLCQMEWTVPQGEASEVGGNAMMRGRAFDAVGGFKEGVTAGEEPELCGRLRSAGGRIMRLDSDMAEHDAGMTRFSQWWRRSKRSGHASMQNLALRGLDGRSHGRQVVTRAVLWAVVAPLLALAMAGVAITRGRADLGLAAVVALVGLWTLKVLRVALRRSRQGESLSGSILYATFNWLAKFAEAIGVIQFVVSKVRGRQPGPVEYKSHQGNA